MNKIIAITLITSLPIAMTAQTWSELLREKQVAMDGEPVRILTEQYQAVVNNNAPAVAVPVIKNIPIIENDEPLTDINTVQNHRISMLPNPPEGKPFYSDSCNAGFPHSSKIRKTVYEKLEKTINHLDESAPQFNHQPGEISIKVFEGLRDKKTQDELFRKKQREIQAKNPHLTEQEVEAETAKWVSPVKNNVPVHSTGAAIDIRLWNDRTKSFVDLGNFGAVWAENKAPSTFSENITDTQKLNRLYLLMAATKAGLVNYTYEWWHYSSGDRYAAYWQEKDIDKRKAHYNSIN